MWSKFLKVSSLNQELLPHQSKFWFEPGDLDMKKHFTSILKIGFSLRMSSADDKEVIGNIHNLP